jgi:hopanoid C-3 methylase
MKILLVNPPRSPENNILKYAPQEAKHFIHKKLIGPPLGLLTVAAAVKDYDVSFLELKGEYDLHPDAPEPEVLVKQAVRDFKPDVVGVTFIASELYYGLDIFKAAKSENPEILTVAGGLHTDLCLSDFNNKWVDVVCPGQSAGTFREVVMAKEKSKDLLSVGGIFVNNGKELIPSNGKMTSWSSAGENYLMPERHHIKKWISTYKVGGSPFPSTYIFTSQGCPYKCTFCSIWPQFGGSFHQRTIESIIHELKSIDDYPVVRFADANTIINVDFINLLFDRIQEEGIRKQYIMDIRTDTAVKYPKLIEKLAKAGLKVVICGFESFREEELKKYNKNSSADYLSQAIEVFHQHDIMLRGNYVIPTDYDDEDFKALTDYAATHKVVYAGYTILTPMPGTVFYDEVKDQIIDHDLSKYNFFNSVMKTKLSLEKFYENVGKLWLIKKGTDVI